jgi:hypothetical protein
MRIAIMQPYLFPYLGYFQLIHAVDAFVFLDDVAFIKKGWINRNKLALNGKATWFSVPLEKQSQNRTICNTRVCLAEFASWKRKLRQSLKHFYGKAPYFQCGESLLEDVLAAGGENMATLAAASIEKCCRLLGIKTEFATASETYPQEGLKNEARLTDICRRADAGEYVNAPGGIGLYGKEQFASKGLQLHFLRPEKIAYRAGDTEHGLNFSILDAIMWCGPERLGVDLLPRYELC